MPVETAAYSLKAEEMPPVGLSVSNNGTFTKVNVKMPDLADGGGPLVRVSQTARRQTTNAAESE